VGDQKPPGCRHCFGFCILPNFNAGKLEINSGYFGTCEPESDPEFDPEHAMQSFTQCKQCIRIDFLSCALPHMFLVSPGYKARTMKLLRSVCCSTAKPAMAAKTVPTRRLHICSGVSGVKSHSPSTSESWSSASVLGSASIDSDPAACSPNIQPLALDGFPATISSTLMSAFNLGTAIALGSLSSWPRLKALQGQLFPPAVNKKGSSSGVCGTGKSTTSIEESSGDAFDLESFCCTCKRL